jgi:branched-chain amino acid transport system ATP-binding protein
MSEQTPKVPAAPDILRLTDVQVRIAGSHILQGIDLTVADGGVTALLGRNGVGKTTTLKAILGLVPCTGSSGPAWGMCRRTVRSSGR